VCYELSVCLSAFCLSQVIVIEGKTFIEESFVRTMVAIKEFECRLAQSKLKTYQKQEGLMTWHRAAQAQATTRREYMWWWVSIMRYRRRRRHLARAAGHWLAGGLQGTMRHWRRHTQLNRVAIIHLRRGLISMLHAARRRAFLRWQCFLGEALEEEVDQMIAIKALITRAKRCFLEALRDWRVVAKASSHREESGAEARVFAFLRRVGVAWEIWLGFRWERRHRRDRLRRGLLGVIHRKALGALGLWREACSHRCVALQASRKGLLARIRRRLAESWASWRALALRFVGSVGVLHRAASAILHRHRGKAWHQWREIYYENAVQHATAQHVLMRWVTGKYSAAFVRWRAECLAHREGEGRCHLTPFQPHFNPIEPPFYPLSGFVMQLLRCSIVSCGAACSDGGLRWRGSISRGRSFEGSC